MPIFTTRVNFNNTNQGAKGRHRVDGVPADAAGDLSGTTALGGSNGDGTVFDIASMDGAYASTPATFDGANGAYPDAGLTAVAGDLSGTTIGTFTNMDTDAAAATATGITTIVAATAAPTLTTLVSFNGTNGVIPAGSLIADAAGDLFSTTLGGGANADGTVFEIAKTGGGFASTPTTLVSFSGTNGDNPEAGLIADAAGDLFGTTSGTGIAKGSIGTVFEIAKSGSRYASTPTVLGTFNGFDNPDAGLIADAAGDFFSTTVYGGVNGVGTVFEIAKTGSGFASTPTTLVSFNGTNGASPYAGLIADAAGDLFGTTWIGGYNYNPSLEDYGDGTVFEIAKTGGGYANTLTTLVSFNGANGEEPFAGLTADAAGDLFGTTETGGANGYGTVFEIAKTGSGYASTPTTLVSFNGTNGADPLGGLIADAAGDLFGTTQWGGAAYDPPYDLGDGTVFEIVKTGGSYANTPTTLASFNGTNGREPYAGLTANAAGDLFGTTSVGGANDDGTVFELSGTGFQVTVPSTTADMLMRNSNTGAFEVYDISHNAITSAAPMGQVGLEWTVAGFGDFSGNANETDMLMRNSNTGAFEVYDISHNAITSAAPMGQVGLEWTVAGFGDFSGNANESDMLMRSSDTGAFEVYDISNNAITSAAWMGRVGLEWTVAGFGDFSSTPGESDMLLRATSGPNAGNFEVYDISNNAVTSAAAMGQVGLEWQVAGFGDFNGNPGESDMLMRATSGPNAGNFEVYDISNNAITSAAPMGQVGLEWTVAGFGDFSGNANESDMLMRSSDTGAFEVYDISNNAITSAGPMGQVGLEWTVAGIAADPPGASSSDLIAQLVQAMASFGASAAVNSSPGLILGGADTSQQTLLTMPH